MKIKDLQDLALRLRGLNTTDQEITDVIMKTTTESFVELNNELDLFSGEHSYTFSDKNIIPAELILNISGFNIIITR